MNIFERILRIILVPFVFIFVVFGYFLISSVKAVFASILYVQGDLSLGFNLKEFEDVINEK